VIDGPTAFATVIRVEARNGGQSDDDGREDKKEELCLAHRCKRTLSLEIEAVNWT
jgi:hypothetical protein